MRLDGVGLSSSRPDRTRPTPPNSDQTRIAFNLDWDTLRIVFTGSVNFCNMHSGGYSPLQRNQRGGYIPPISGPRGPLPTGALESYKCRPMRSGKQHRRWFNEGIPTEDPQVSSAAKQRRLRDVVF
jgi:hypothetical protein